MNKLILQMFSNMHWMAGPRESYDVTDDDQPSQLAYTEQLYTM